MAASNTLSHSHAIPQIPKSGVLTLSGYGIRVTMQAGHLRIEHCITGRGNSPGAKAGIVFNHLAGVDETE